MDLIVTMTEHHIWLIGEMIDRAATLSADQVDIPITISVPGIDEQPTLRSLLSRLVGQMQMWNAAVAGRPYDFAVEQHEGFASMRRRLSECGPAFSAHVRDTCERGAFNDTFVDATGDRPMFSRTAG